MDNMTGLVFLIARHLPGGVSPLAILAFGLLVALVTAATATIASAVPVVPGPILLAPLRW